jgi:hypothetical protein
MLITQGLTNVVLNRHRQRLPPQSSEHDNNPLPDLPIRYYPQPPNCPDRSHIKPSTIHSNSQIILYEPKRDKSPKSHEWNHPLDFYRGSIN